MISEHQQTNSIESGSCKRGIDQTEHLLRETFCRYARTSHLRMGHSLVGIVQIIPAHFIQRRLRKIDSSRASIRMREQLAQYQLVGIEGAVWPK